MKYQSPKQFRTLFFISLFQRAPSSGPAPFPTVSETTRTTQNPPKRVDEIMTEINQFDPTILTSSSFQFGAQNIQPEEIKSTINNHRNYQDNSETGQVSKYIITSHLSKIDDYNSEIDQQDSIKVLVGNSTENITLDSDPQGPPPVPKGGAPPSAVYYPPGQLYSADSQQSDVIISQGSTEDRKKNPKEKKFRNDEDYANNQGAAVIPICLPLCCAAPCVIL